MRKIFLFATLLSLLSCYKEDKLSATTEDEPFVNLETVKNQGDKRYTQRLLDYNEKYGILTLYDFEDYELIYEITKDAEVYYTQADEEYVGGLLDIIDETFFELLGDSIIMEIAPLKMLIVDELHAKPSGMTEKVNCYMGANVMTFAGAGEGELSKLTGEAKNLFKAEAIHNFIQKGYQTGVITIPEEFKNLSLQNNSKVSITDNYNEFGYFSYTASLEVEIDFTDFLEQMIYFSEAELSATDRPMSPRRDRNGLIRAKYDVLLDYLKSINVDIKKITETKY